MAFSRIIVALKPRLVTALLLAFSCLVIPALILVLTVSHYQSERAIRSHLDAELGRTKLDFERAITSFFRPLADVTGVIASAAAVDPAAVERDSFNDLLYRTLSNIDHIVSLTVAFEDGFARNFARITPEMRTHHPEYPNEAQWVVRTARDTASGSEGRFTEVFFGDYPQVIASSAPARMPDFLDTDAYLGAQRTGQLRVELTTGVVSGLPVVSMSNPMKKNGVFSGAVTANVTVSELSEFLLHNQISDNSESVILDAKSQIIAASSAAPAARDRGPAAASKPLSLNAIQRRVVVVDAITSEVASQPDSDTVTADIEGVEYSIADFPVANPFGLQYRAIIITPLNDFVGDLRRSSQIFSIIIAALFVVEALLMVHLARRMARRLSQLSKTIELIQGMHFDERQFEFDNPPVREVAELQRGISLLQNALRSFALYVPLGVVRRLVEEGKAIAPGVERREMTILFCDLENFSTLAQNIPAEDLLIYTTKYFSIATEAITRHGGTVDKFIGDAVMGFWGAPQVVGDHAVRACRAAVDIVKGLEHANQVWEAEGKGTLRVRVGLNSASVLVGNIGSPDRLSYTAIGDGVNVASRLEGKNKELGSQICISDSTYERAKDQIVVRPLKPVSVKGRTGEFMVYELLDIVAAGASAQKVAQL